MSRGPCSRQMTRPLLPKRQTKTDEARWARLVKERDNYLCMLEEYNKHWWGCYNRGTDAAHIFRRNECGKLKFSDKVLGITACRQHHDRLHKYDKHVRVPPRRVEWARAYLIKMHKKGLLKVPPRGFAS